VPQPASCRSPCRASSTDGRAAVEVRDDLDAHGVAPAIDYATNGFAVSEIIGGQWLASARKLAADPRAAATFLPNGRRRTRGSVREPETRRHAADDRDEGRDAFYTGPIARAIAADVRQRDGLLDRARLRRSHIRLDRPISTNYRGYDVYELPPNTQGSSCSRC
jgi:gamma-glutamyltranspeptidase/glutathione hydrolase